MSNHHMLRKSGEWSLSCSLCMQFYPNNPALAATVYGGDALCYAHFYERALPAYVTPTRPSGSWPTRYSSQFTPSDGISDWLVSEP